MAYHSELMLNAASFQSDFLFKEIKNDKEHYRISIQFDQIVFFDLCHDQKYFNVSAHMTDYN